MTPTRPEVLVDPYAAPAVSLAAADRLRRRSGLLVLAAVVGFGIAVVLFFLGLTAPAILVLLVLALLSVLGAGYAALALAKGASLGAGAAITSSALLIGHGVMTCLGMAIALLSSMAFSRGRQIRVRGRIMLPPVENGEAWTMEVVELGAEIRALDPETRHALAAQWRESGRTEHASVAAFARLRSASWRSARRPSWSPPRTATRSTRSAMLSRPVALAELAIDSLVDGALHEGVSARVIARLAARIECTS